MKKFVIKYSGHREVIAENETEAKQKAWDCMLSVQECLEIEDVDSSDKTEYCECEIPLADCVYCKEEKCTEKR
jgi:hypothetical protein